jgi:hypothetical protein
MRGLVDLAAHLLAMGADRRQRVCRDGNPAVCMGCFGRRRYDHPPAVVYTAHSDSADESDDDLFE